MWIFGIRGCLFDLICRFWCLMKLCKRVKAEKPEHPGTLRDNTDPVCIHIDAHTPIDADIMYTDSLKQTPAETCCTSIMSSCRTLQIQHLILCVDLLIRFPAGGTGADPSWLGEKPWTGRQIIAGLTHRDKQQFTLTPKVWINLI